MIKFGVTIIQASQVKYKHHYIESDSLLGVARIISTFKVTRGFEVVKIMVEEAETLDLELSGYVDPDKTKEVIPSMSFDDGEWKDFVGQWDRVLSGSEYAKLLLNGKYGKEIKG